MKKPAPAIARQVAEIVGSSGAVPSSPRARAAGPFLAETGLGPETLRTAAADPQFLAGVLDSCCATTLPSKPLLPNGLGNSTRPRCAAALARRWSADALGARRAVRRCDSPPEPRPGPRGLLPGLPRRPDRRRPGGARPAARRAIACHPDRSTPDPRPYRLRRVLRHGREARQSRARRQAGRSSAAASAAWSSAACYIARTFGVRSAMPMFKALALCPQAVVVPPDMAKYVRVGREVRHAMLELTPLVEPLSIDEAFLDLSGTERLHGMIAGQGAGAVRPRASSARSASPSRSACRCNKFLAKIASDLDKPRGFAVLDSGRGPRDAGGQAGRLHLRRRPGDAERLLPARLSHHRRSAARRRDRADAAVRRRGPRLWRLARGIDDRAVVPDRGAKSMSAETTFETDIASFRTLEKMLWRLSEKVSSRLKSAELVRLHRHAEAEDRGFPAAHPRADSIHAPTQLAGEDLRRRRAKCWPRRSTAPRSA